MVYIEEVTGRSSSTRERKHSVHYYSCLMNDFRREAHQFVLGIPEDPLARTFEMEVCFRQFSLSRSSPVKRLIEFFQRPAAVVNCLGERAVAPESTAYREMRCGIARVADASSTLHYFLWQTVFFFFCSVYNLVSSFNWIAKWIRLHLTRTSSLRTIFIDEPFKHVRNTRRCSFRMFSLDRLGYFPCHLHTNFLSRFIELILLRKICKFKLARCGFLISFTYAK